MATSLRDLYDRVRADAVKNVVFNTLELAILQNQARVEEQMLKFEPTWSLKDLCYLAKKFMKGFSKGRIERIVDEMLRKYVYIILEPSSEFKCLIYNGLKVGHYRFHFWLSHNLKKKTLFVFSLSRARK